MKNFMLIIFLRVNIRERRVLLNKTSFFEIITLFTLFLNRRNKKTYYIFFLKDINNYDSLKKILKRNNFFDKVKTTKILLTKIKVNKLK